MQDQLIFNILLQTSDVQISTNKWLFKCSFLEAKNVVLKVFL